jgi:drug/metabolite transporter (DMT)-like permease
LLGGEIEIMNTSQALRLFALVFIDIFNYSLFFYTIKRLSATFTTLVDYVVPIVGIFLGYIFLDEIVSNVFFITLFLIFISLYLAVRDEEKNLY